MEYDPEGISVGGVVMKNLDLFGNEVEVIDPPKGRKKTPRMQEMFGTVPGKTCGECKYHCAYVANRVWHKCELWLKLCFPMGGHSEASDIRLKWPACGKFEEGGDGDA